MNCTFTWQIHLLTTKKALASLLLVLVCLNCFGQASYTWQPVAGSTSWADGGNWSPTRTILATNDVLIFDGSQTKNATVTLDFAVSQTVGQLVFTNAVTATLSTGGDRTLTVGAQPPAVGLQMDAGTLVKVVGTQGSNSALAIKLVTNVRALIVGRLEFLGVASISTNSTHTLVSSTIWAVEFMDGSYFLAGLKFGGNPFGSAKGSTGSVVFHAGATCEQASGATPFGSNTYDVISLEARSLFLYTSNGSNEIGLAGHSFGYLRLNTTRSMANSTYSTEPTIILNDLIISGGAHIIDVAQVDLKGNLVLDGGSLSFPPIAGNNLTLTLSGTNSQAVGGTASGSLLLPANVSLVLNNAAGLTLQRPLQINGSLNLNQGLLTTTATNNLTLGPMATIIGGSATSFIDGPLSRIQTGTAVNLTFPIGSDKVCRPIVLTGQQADAATIYTAQQFNQAPVTRTFPTAVGSLQRVSKVRYFNVTNNGASGFTQGTVKLNYDADDRVDAPAKLRIAKSDNAGNWLDLGGTGSGAPGGSITSAVAFTSFSDFVLASTEAIAGPGNNPLPISLTRFTARREPAGVRLRWATATERDNRHFEVLRSTDGQVFSILKKVLGHGNSTSAQEYVWLDEIRDTNSLVYYRLRQVDTDNTGTYSPVVAVQAGAVVAGVFPNPAYDHLGFYAAAGDTYWVLDVFGRPMLMGQAMIGLNTLALNDLKTGVYCLEITSAQGRARHRFVKGGAGQ